MRLFRRLNPKRILHRAGVLRPDLLTVLQRVNPSASLGERVEWLESLIDWVRIPIRPTKETQGTKQLQSARLKFLFLQLDRNQELKKRVARSISSILLESDSLGVFSQLGLSRESGFFSEALERVLRKFIPMPHDERDLAELFVRVFRDENDADWIEELDEGANAHLRELLFLDAATEDLIIQRFASSVQDALVVLTAQITAYGLSPEIRSRAGITEIRTSGFYRLSHQAGELSQNTKLIPDFLATLITCRSEVQSALSHLDAHGVSVAIVYRLELLEQALERAERLAKVLGSGAIGWRGLVADLIRSRFEAVELTSLIQDNLHLLARKIVERTGVSGEHYIVRNRKEYVAMLFSAAGGGFLTVGTTLLKFLTARLQAAPFVEGVFFWVNYSGSFLLMQAMHFALASKQPAMTAPALAAKLQSLKRRAQLYEFVEEVARLTRSQFAAALGNIGMVIPTALCFDLLWSLATGHSVLRSDYAQKTLTTHGLLSSLTIGYAAFTGVLLWLSSIAAGWIENWVVYRRLPEAIAQSRMLRRGLSDATAQGVSAWFARNISGIGGNLSVGFLLAFSPVFAKFFGLPLDVRHVTLSAGSLTFALCGLGVEKVGLSHLLDAAAAVIGIGIMNFGVSFALALTTALKARRIKKVWLRHLGGLVWAKLRYQPLDFFFPMRKSSRPDDWSE